MARQPNYVDRRMYNGGSRKWSGLKPKTERKIFCKHLMQWAIVLENRHGQMRRVRVRFVELILDSLFDKGMHGDVRAIKQYLNFVFGEVLTPGPKGEYRVRQHWYTKPVQRIIYAHASKPVEVIMQGNRMIGYLKKQRIIVQLPEYPLSKPNC